MANLDCPTYGGLRARNLGAFGLDIDVLRETIIPLVYLH
jgi:hypothetical protein